MTTPRAVDPAGRPRVPSATDPNATDSNGAGSNGARSTGWLDRRRGRRSVAEAAGLWALSRVWFWGVAAAVHAWWPGAHSGHGGFVGLLYQWDALWFACIARSGYGGSGDLCPVNPVGGRPAFFPGYPLAGRALAWATGAGSLTDSGVVTALWLVTQVAALVAAVLLYQLLLAHHDRRTARWGVALLLFGPYAVFLVASYSEALFLVFAVGAWRAAGRQRYLLAGVLAAGASLTRVNGVFLVAALLVLWWQQHHREPRWGGVGRAVRQVAALAVGAVGAVGYFGWLWHSTGDVNAWNHAQRTYFHRVTEEPWRTFFHSARALVQDHRSANVIQHSLEFVAAGALVLAVVVLVRRRRWAEVTYVGLTAASLMTSTTYLSLARSTLVLFPLYGLAAGAIVAGRRRRLVVVLVALGLLVSLVNTVQLARGQWAD